MTLRERFAENLVRARRASGQTQEDLADRCNLHRTEVSLFERAGREPRLGALVKLASALGVTPEALYAGIGWDEKRQRFTLSK